MTTTNTGDISFVPTCNDVSVSVLHPVLVFLGRVPWCRLSFKEALWRKKKREREIVNTTYIYVYLFSLSYFNYLHIITILFIDI
jgi:hypothetical protein